MPSPATASALSRLPHGAVAWVALAAAPLLFAAPACAADAATIVTTVCAACHGPDGNSPAPNFPKLAGQQPAYLEKQLKEFMSGKRKNDAMAPFLPKISEDDIPALAAYFAGQKTAPGTVADPTLVTAGKKLYDDGNESTGVPACQGCHLPNGAGNERFPKLAGQNQMYVLQQLANFKSGERRNDKGKIMRTVAERMSEQEMKAVAEYIAGL
jgi:cytochrome c553